LTALGVVYGDIGTSPLYAFRESFHGHHAVPATPTNIFGVLSLIFWSLVLVVTIKYIVFVLRADNRGEGGILALMALATPIRRLAPSARPWLVLLGIFGAALLYGDGIITPAISVLSAVEGLTLETPFFKPYVIPLASAIIVGLFVIQSRGTATIGQFFGPVMVLWFLVLAILGAINLVQFPSVVGAVNPLHAVTFFREDGWTGFLVLGTVFLVLTGGEALYADLGHFGRKPIRLGWFTVALPALLLNYAGQGALLLRNPQAAENPFYLMAPTWARYPLIGLATLATIIASQALISGAYSITLQGQQLGFLPRMRIVHTSSTSYGQIYIPFVNWALMIACLLTVISFRSSTNLAAAYGIAVTTTMAITTILFGVVARRRWRWSPVLVGLLGGFFLLIDSAFLGANLIKIPQGGWFPLVVAAIILVIMTTWKQGIQLVFTREQDLEMSLKRLQERFAANPPLRVPGTAIFFSSRPGGAPAALLANLKYNGIVHERVLLLTVVTSDVPHLRDEERLTVEELGMGLYRGSMRYGFMEEPNVPQDLPDLVGGGLLIDRQQTPYFVSRTRVIPTKLPGMALWREQLFRVLQQNAASPADFFCLPPAQVFEIATSIEL
jgi:KUP system potassium uptake protein